MTHLTRRRVLGCLVGTGASFAAAGVLAGCSSGATAAPTAAPPATKPQPTTAPVPTKAAVATPASASKPAVASPTTVTTTSSTTPPAQKDKEGMLITHFALKGAHLQAWAYQSFTPSGDRFIQEQVAQWGKENGGSAEYNVVQNSVFVQKLAAAIEAKAIPDLIMVSDVLYYQGLGILTDLTTEYNKLNKMAGGFYKSLVPGYELNGKMWGIPIETGPSPLFSRLDKIQEATGKRQPPSTLDEMEAIAKKVNKPTGFYGIGWTLGKTPDCEGNTLDIIHNDGGALVTKDGTKPAIMSNETISAMTRIKRWWDEKLIPPDSVSGDDMWNNSAYQSKRVAFVDNPASIYAWLVTHDQKLLANTSMSPIPAGKAGSYSSGAGGWCWTVSNQSKNRDAAIALVDFLLLPDNLELECEKIRGRWYPTYRDLANRSFWTSKPQFADFPKLIDSAIYESYPAPPKPELMAALGEVDSVLTIADMTQAVIVSNTPIEKAVSDAQAKMEAIFKKYKL